MAEDTKPDPDALSKPETITIRVKGGQGGQEMMFKVKKTTKMAKVFVAYAARYGIGADTIRFFLDGQRIDKEKTPADVGLEDNDQIDALMEQQGGRGW